MELIYSISSLQDALFSCSIIYFCNRQALEKYQDWMPAFEDSRECKLLKKLIEAHDNDSADSFAEAIADYDKITRIDEWLTTILLRIKKTIHGGDDDAPDMT